MIKSDKGIVEVNGTGSELLADLGVIAASIKKNMVKYGLPESLVVEKIKDAVNMGLEAEESSSEGISQSRPPEIMEMLESLFGKRG